MRYLTLLPFMGLVAIAASTGTFFQPGAWYDALAKPSFTPPGWLFGPVWTVIYALIAIAGWLVWRAEGFSFLLAVWAAQLVFNTAWSWLMFGQHAIGWAFADIVLMWLSIAVFMALAWPAYPLAVAFFGIYLAWVTFAATLNFRIWQLNPAAS